MSSESFDKTFNGITSGAYDRERQEQHDFAVRWVESGLKNQLAMINPDSGITERGLALHEARRKDHENYMAMRARSSENPLEAEVQLSAELSSLLTESRRSTSRWGVFLGLYYDIQLVMNEGASDDAADYDALVARGCEISLKRIAYNPNMLKMVKDDLSSLVNELAMIYRLEPDRHFSPPIGGDRES